MQTGSHAANVKIGSKAVINPLISCGVCDRCRRGLDNLCDRRQIVGIHRSGAFAEYVAVPAASVHLVPDSLNSFRASLAEPLACCLRAAKRALSVHPFANVLDVDIIQPDVGWCGGLTELIKIGNLAESSGKLVVPHGSGVYSHHYVVTKLNSPFTEYIVMSPGIRRRTQSRGRTC